MSKKKEIISFILRLCIAIALIYFITRGHKSLIIKTLHSVKPMWLVIAFFCFVVSFFFCILRWNQLLKIQNVKISLWQTLNLGMQGMFFSLFIPGAVGGDIAKATLIATVAEQGTKAKAAFSILIDRILGLIGLFFLAGLLGIISYEKLSTLPDSVRLVSLFFIFGSIISGIATAFLFMHRLFEKIYFIKKILQIADKHTKGIPGHLMEALDNYRQSYVALILWIIGSAIFVHLPQGLAVYCIANGIGESNQSIQYVVLSAAMANAVGAIPLTPSGLGTRDLVISTMFSAVGISKEKAISIALLNTGIIILFNLIGGVFFVSGHRKNSSDSITRDEIRTDEQ